VPRRFNDASIIEGTDLPMIQLAMTAMMDTTRQIEPMLYRRYLTIFLDGMRGDRGPISELPVDALSLDKASHAFRTSGEQQPNFAPNSKR
jgi:hypothetical protein